LLLLKRLKLPKILKRVVLEAEAVEAEAVVTDMRVEDIDMKDIDTMATDMMGIDMTDTDMMAAIITMDDTTEADMDTVVQAARTLMIQSTFLDTVHGVSNAFAIKSFH
jgi:hypothetical protein